MYMMGGFRKHTSLIFWGCFLCCGGKGGDYYCKLEKEKKKPKKLNAYKNVIEI